MPSATSTRLIRPPVPSTPSGQGASGGAKRGLPDDLLREASRRLGILCLLGAGLWVLATILAHLSVLAMAPSDPAWRRLVWDDSIAVVAVLVSLALYAYTRRPGVDPGRVLSVGLGYMVLTAFALGMTLHWHPLPPGMPLPALISWAGVIVVMTAAIVPTEPAKMAVFGTAAVAMMPASMFIARARGTWPFENATDAFVMHYLDFLLVGVAVVISHVVTGLGRQVARAREMGSYQLGELLGRGGMGEVYRASHRLLARPAAIKLIRPERLGNGDADDASARLVVKRFYREAEAAANLRSSHTVQLYDFGVTDDQTLYFVMELLEGMNLDTLVREHGPVPAGRAVRILAQACDSLEEAHARGLVHRDIKPANIHVGRVGLEHDFVKVLDFGLVKAVRDSNGAHESSSGGAARAADREAAGGVESSLATAEGPNPGTPAFMAPELSMGEPFDGRTDLYALGCVAFWLLTGRLVFETDLLLRMIAKHLREKPDPPSAHAPYPVPEALDRAVLACLAKSPDDRPPNAGALRRMLETAGAEPWTEAQARAWWETRPSS